MLLYHGSNLIVEKPQIIPSKRLLDFGTGFYLTSDYNQAEKWSVRTAKRREDGNPIISIYDIDEAHLSKLKLLKFDYANREWLHYISDNRTNQSAKDAYDVVIGPVANDQAFRTINNYLKGYFNEDIALELLLPQRLKDQYTFKTERALSFLKFKEADIL
ncbi:MAG: DUF3990 domain-containing protein [Eubacterium sp.]|nr:DUF3990 domain-containing protein [Eubacterium sp.]